MGRFLKGTFLHFGILLWFSVNAWSQYSASPDASGHLILHGPNCRTLIAQTEALRLWSLHLHESPGAIQGGYHLQVDDVGEVTGCSVDITSVTPSLIRRIHGTNPRFDGPNCWDTALFLSQIVPSLRYADSEEIRFALAPPLCRLLTAQEQRLPGDILEVRNHSGEIHAFIHVSDQLVFSKNGMDRRAPYALQSTNNVMTLYRMQNTSPECLHSESTDPPGCARWINRYRCRTLSDLTEDPLVLENERIRTAFGQLDTHECNMSEIVKIGQPMTDRTFIRENIALLKVFAEQELAGVAGPPNSTRRQLERFLWGLIVRRATSLLLQTYHIPNFDYN